MTVLLTVVFSLLAKFLLKREPITEEFPPDTQSTPLSDHYPDAISPIDCLID